MFTGTTATLSFLYLLATMTNGCVTSEFPGMLRFLILLNSSYFAAWVHQLCPYICNACISTAQHYESIDSDKL